MYCFGFRVGRSELVFTNEGKLILFEETFEVKTYFFRLIEVSDNTLSATLMSDLLFKHLKNVVDQLQNSMAQTGFENLNPLILMVVTDQLQNLMIETGFENLNNLLLMVTQADVNFHSLVYICYMTTYFAYFSILVIDYMGV